MKKFILVFILISLLGQSLVKADEGMWMLPLLAKLNMKDMQELGCNLSAEDIYNINKSSLKDAIVIFGGGCTGEIISKDGLVLTNHHCGFDFIQDLSSVENDYLKKGFWAMSREEELPCENNKVTFLIRVEDVTKDITDFLKDDMSEAERQLKIDEITEKIEGEAVKDTDYKASVEEFFGGNKYYMMVYREYTDIRLVGAPPSSIGKFGGDTDNWMWPRHTGDFSLFRVYADKDGNPAPYSKDNVPLKPKHHLPVSLKGVNIGDFAMIMGFPGGTQRFMTSYGIKQLMEVTNRNRIDIRQINLDIMKADMMKDDKVQLQYATRYAQSSNYYKFSIGQNEGIRDQQVLEKKKELENKFVDWVNENEERKEEYGEALTLIQDGLKKCRPYEYTTHFLLESFYLGSEVIKFAWSAYALNYYLGATDDMATLQPLLDGMKQEGEKFFKNYNAPTDRKVTTAMFSLFDTKIQDELKPDIFSEMKGKYEKYADNIFEKSIFTDEQRYNAFLEKPSSKVLSKDPGFRASVSIFSKYIELDDYLSNISGDLDKGRRLFIAGLLEMQKEGKFYPDANFTMRLTYGSVKDYFPRDAVHYLYMTTTDGILEKEDANNWEFIVPEKLKQLHESGDFGEYGLDGSMPVCFLTNNDITGGNSGSPVINGDGHIIGLAFDGNWEAMSGDIIFEPQLQRCINVDIRYVLFIIDKYAGAGHLIEEMTLVR